MLASRNDLFTNATVFCVLPLLLVFEGRTGELSSSSAHWHTESTDTCLLGFGDPSLPLYFSGIHCAGASTFFGHERSVLP